LSVTGTAVADAIASDPPSDKVHPPLTLAKAIFSGGVNINAVLYAAAGAGPRATVLLLHGLPGNEQNLDLAQSIRRAGWNVLTLHYRGAWGSPGNFSFAHCLEDACAAVEWLRNQHNVDSRQLVLIGHSMGGYVAANIAANDPGIVGAALISGVDIGTAFGMMPRNRACMALDENVGTSAGLHILSGTSPKALAEEVANDAKRWSLVNFAAALVGRPLLLITSDDGFASGSDALATTVAKLGTNAVRRVHLATDHSYSDCRIALQGTVLDWLQEVGSKR
jgi:pimeloyl-ACP methyl ester carboxylesterase